MTDAEVICTWMEPRPPLPAYWSGPTPSPKGWWGLVATSGGGMEWIPWRNGGPLDLDALWEVEERLTDEQWPEYLSNLFDDDWQTSDWRLYRNLTHMPADQKIRALAAVLRPLVEGAAK